MHPSEQIQLYGLDKYFNEIKKLYDLKKMPNKIMLSGKKGSGKSTMAYHIINYILSQSEENKYDIEKFSINSLNRSYKLLKNKLHPNFYLIDLIDEKKNIEISQIRQMINYTNKSSFNEIPRFILIDNIENLNKNSSNALLKIIEEPNENIFFILIHNNNKRILPTLKSRCLTFKINLSFKQTVDICNFLLNENLLNLINNDLINYYSTPGDFINLINFGKEKKIDLKEFTLVSFLYYLIDNNYYKKDKFIKDLIISYIELYFLKRYQLSNTKNKILDIYYNFTKKINNTNTFNLDDESLFLEFKSKLLNG
jgi:DNA polymerase-3 subunit delta'